MYPEITIYFKLSSIPHFTFYIIRNNLIAGLMYFILPLKTLSTNSLWMMDVEHITQVPGRQSLKSITF